MLWDQGATSFLPHGLAGGADDARQPILLSTSPDAPNLARNMLIADGEWREAALGFDRAFYLFDDETLEGARLAWKLLSGRDGVERHYLGAGRRRPLGRKSLSLAPAGRAARRCRTFQPLSIQETARPWRSTAPFRSSSPTPPAAT